MKFEVSGISDELVKGYKLGGITGFTKKGTDINMAKNVFAGFNKVVGAKRATGNGRKAVVRSPEKMEEFRKRVLLQLKSGGIVVSAEKGIVKKFENQPQHLVERVAAALKYAATVADVREAAADSFKALDGADWNHPTARKAILACGSEKKLDAAGMSALSEIFGLTTEESTEAAE